MLHTYLANLNKVKKNEPLLTVMCFKIKCGESWTLCHFYMFYRWLNSVAQSCKSE